MPEAPQPIRVLLATLPELLAQVVSRVIEQQPDMLLSGHARDTNELLQMTNDEITVIVMGMSVIYPLPGICSHLFAEWPDLNILVIDPAGMQAVHYRLALQHAKLTLPTNRSLLTRIRRIAKMNSAV